MTSEAPPFWWEKPDWRAWALLPFSAAYGFVAARRMLSAPRVKVPLPVLCVGNLTVGGAGKTPVAIALARQAAAMGRRPGFLSRGHGGGAAAPKLVDAARDGARQVGDEPLLLAAQAPVAVTPDRVAGAALLREKGCDFVIMDDGFQSARIHIDFALLVVDAHRGIGNGHTIPGGPMRAPLVPQLRHADAVLALGTGDAADAVVRHAARAGRTVFHARVRPVESGALAGRRFLAFAGIGNPQKFFDSVAEAGGAVEIARGFPDHHFYSDEELGDLLATARAAGVELVTTAKDAARLRHGSQRARNLLDDLTILEIETVFEAPAMPVRIVEETLAAWKARMIREGVPQGG